MKTPKTWKMPDGVKSHFVMAFLDAGKEIIAYKHYRRDKQRWVYGCRPRSVLEVGIWPHCELT